MQSSPRERPALRDPRLAPRDGRAADARAKGIPYKRIDLMPVISKGVLRAAGASPATPCPALKIDGRRVQGSRAIARELDRIAARAAAASRPTPAQRAAVEEAERLGDEDLQQRRVRRILWWRAATRPRAACAATPRGRKLGVPDRPRGQDRRADRRRSRPASTRRPTTNVRADLAALPGTARPDRRLDRGRRARRRPQPNAADFQIAPSLRLVMTSTTCGR